MIKLYNTLTKRVDEFKSLKNNEVSIYTCGPTVYDYPHIGNWYTFIRWDLLVRMLKQSGYQTKWAMNITDVGHLTSDADEGEDKLAKKALHERTTAWAIAKEYTDYFMSALKRLNMLKPDILPKATENITAQIKFIAALEKLGYTYKIDDGIYFDSIKIPEYGRLAGLNIDNQPRKSRIALNAQKKNPTDFALWKFSPNGKKRDMEWDSPWGKGFPGWHLECSTLIKEYLGVTIDIHGGGIDHIPIHHTNEIAQSQAANNAPLANYWLHSNFVKVNGQKMSKSLGNLVTLEDVEAKGFDLEAFRLLVLESHYRSEAQFSWDTLKSAQNRLSHYRSIACLKWQSKNLPSNGPELYNTDNILDALQNDINSPEALRMINAKFDILIDKLLPSADMDHFEKMLVAIDNLLGLKLSKIKDISEGQKQLISQREQARKAKNWRKSDELRQLLKDQGIELRDSLVGPIWSPSQQ